MNFFCEVSSTHETLFHQKVGSRFPSINSKSCVVSDRHKHLALYDSKANKFIELYHMVHGQIILLPNVSLNKLSAHCTAIICVLFNFMKTYVHYWEYLQNINSYECKILPIFHSLNVGQLILYIFQLCSKCALRKNNFLE